MLIMLSFGWYAVNKQANVNSGTGLTSDNNNVLFSDTITAEINYLNHTKAIETYKRRDNGSLYLTKRSLHDLELDTITNTNYTEADNIGFFIRSLLPGEYVDITIGFSITDDFDHSSYSIGFMNVNGGGSFNKYFMLDSHKHYAMGAYKWKNISLKDSSNTVINDFSNADYNWFSSYDINSDDDTNLRIESLNGIWDKDYESLNYTFRVFEDFTQYYELVGKSSTYTGDALLSFLTLQIGFIYVML
jgi:hypothetical protein